MMLLMSKAISSLDLCFVLFCFQYVQEKNANKTIKETESSANELARKHQNAFSERVNYVIIFHFNIILITSDFRL